MNFYFMQRAKFPLLAMELIQAARSWSRNEEIFMTERATATPVSVNWIV